MAQEVRLPIRCIEPLSDSITDSQERVGHSRRLGKHSPVEVVPLKQPLERAPPCSRSFRCLSEIPGILSQKIHEVPTFKFQHRPQLGISEPESFFACTCSTICSRLMRWYRWITRKQIDILVFQLHRGAQDHTALDHALQFPHISRPVVGQ